MKFRTTIDGRSFQIEVEHEQLVRIDGRPVYLEIEQVGGLPLYALRLDDQAYLLFVEPDQEQYQVEVRGQVFPVLVEPSRPRLPVHPADCPEPEHGTNGCLCIAAPLPGRLLSLPVTAGEPVDEGQVVAVLESMKMQLDIKAPRAGTIVAVHAEPDSDVAQGTSLLTIQPAS